MIEKPAGFRIEHINGGYELSFRESWQKCKNQEKLFTESQLKAERERAIEMQLKINKELAETVTRLELEIARLISA
jgi:hypothetical protein